MRESITGLPFPNKKDPSKPRSKETANVSSFAQTPNVKSDDLPEISKKQNNFNNYPPSKPEATPKQPATAQPVSQTPQTHRPYSAPPTAVTQTPYIPYGYPAAYPLQTQATYATQSTPQQNSQNFNTPQSSQYNTYSTNYSQSYQPNFSAMNQNQSSYQQTSQTDRQKVQYISAANSAWQPQYSQWQNAQPQTSYGQNAKIYNPYSNYGASNPSRTPDPVRSAQTSQTGSIDKAKPNPFDMQQNQNVSIPRRLFVENAPYAAFDRLRHNVRFSSNFLLSGFECRPGPAYQNEQNEQNFSNPYLNPTTEKGDSNINYSQFVEKQARRRKKQGTQKRKKKKDWKKNTKENKPRAKKNAKENEKSGQRNSKEETSDSKKMQNEKPESKKSEKTENWNEKITPETSEKTKTKTPEEKSEQQTYQISKGQNVRQNGRKKRNTRGRMRGRRGRSGIVPTPGISPLMPPPAFFNMPGPPPPAALGFPCPGSDGKKKISLMTRRNRRNQRLPPPPGHILQIVDYDVKEIERPQLIPKNARDCRQMEKLSPISFLRKYKSPRDPHFFVCWDFNTRGCPRGNKCRWMHLKITCPKINKKFFKGIDKTVPEFKELFPELTKLGGKIAWLNDKTVVVVFNDAKSAHDALENVKSDRFSLKAFFAKETSAALKDSKIENSEPTMKSENVEKPVALPMGVLEPAE